MSDKGSSPESRPGDDAAGRAEADDQPLSEIRKELNRQRELVPWIGESRNRWYDFPYWLLNALFVKRAWWARLPRWVRLMVTQMQNWLLLFYEYDRDKIAFPDDPIHNVIIPADEHVQLPAIWAVELFSPAYASGLLKAVNKRSWPQERRAVVPGEELDNQLRRSRERDTGMWGPIGSFVSNSSKASWALGAKKEDLPDGIERIEVQVQAISPALTAVVATFFLDADAQDLLDATLKSDHPPRIIWANRRLNLYHRMFSGINDVQGVRAHLHSIARSWLSKKLPGIFAVEGDGRLPVLDMLLTHHYDPGGGDRDPDDANYLRALGLEQQLWTQVTSPELPGFVLGEYLPERLRSDDRSQWVLVANFSSAFSDDAFQHYGDPIRSARNIAFAADDSARFLLSRLAITELLDLKLRKLNRSRDIAATIHSGFRPVKSLKQLRSEVLTGSLDLDAIADDLIRFTGNRRRYEYGVPPLWLEPGRWQSGIPGTEKDEINKQLLADWAKSQAAKVRQLTEADQSLMGLLNIAASLTSSLSQLRTQRWAIMVSVVSLVAAVIAVWLAYLALHTG